MKKKLLFIVFVSFSFSASSQRYCDLATIVIVPANLSSIANGDILSPAFRIKNLGPDSLAIGDSLTFGMKIDNDLIPGTSGVIRLPKILKKDSSFFISYSGFKLTFPSSGNGQHSICAFVNITSSKTKVTDTANANNEICNFVIFTNGTGIGKINHILADNITLYPNPSRDLLNIDLSVENENLFNFEIFDVTGKLIKSEIHFLTKGKQSVRLQLNSFEEGIYTCKITSQKYFLISKFSIK